MEPMCPSFDVEKFVILKSCRSPSPDFSEQSDSKHPGLSHLEGPGAADATLPLLGCGPFDRPSSKLTEHFETIRDHGAASSPPNTWVPSHAGLIACTWRLDSQF
ncbi:hypothetical protein P7K49_009096 [Saguinus oedipus]|uniref:Uncharacterized protein n=1 Tax=Saguinus oedipus TaxID=9490 RepID=A0ABQ9VZJ7_SAGOE|nr:hypothetical protein P7K49_009096 [Saguinus oedipus]